MAAEIQNATNAFSQHKSPFITLTAPFTPKYSAKTGVPVEKITNAALMVSPRNPHTSALGSMPNPASLYLPFFIRKAITSPRVASKANLMKLMTIPCEALKFMYAAYTSLMRKNGSRSRMITIMKTRSLRFMMISVDIGKDRRL